MIERRSKQRWLEKLFVAMRRLSRLRELPQSAQVDEAIANEPPIIRELYEATAKSGALPAEWPASVAAIAKELGLLDATEHARLK